MPFQPNHPNYPRHELAPNDVRNSTTPIRTGTFRTGELQCPVVIVRHKIAPDNIMKFIFGQRSRLEALWES